MKKVRLTESDLRRIVKRVITEQKTNTDKLFTITGIFSTHPDKLLTNIGGKDTYIKLRLNIMRDKCMDCTLPKGKEITVRGYTENGAPPSSSNELVVDESGFSRGSNNGGEQDMIVKRMINSQLIRKIEDLIRGINSYDELLYNIKRVVMRVINIIIRDFSKNNVLTFNKKSLINHISRSMENHPQIRKYVSRNNMGRLMDIIKQELHPLKGTEDIVMNSNVDTDNDGIPNRLDIDDDNDGVMDPNDID